MINKYAFEFFSSELQFGNKKQVSPGIYIYIYMNLEK